jgi:hypothetical protein
MRDLIDIIGLLESKTLGPSKDDVKKVLEKNGYTNFKDTGNKLQVLVQIPDSNKKTEFRIRAMQEIEKILKKAFPKSGVEHSDDARLSSLGGIIFADSLIKVLVKDTGKQGDQSSGIANEIELAGIITSMIEEYKKVNVKFVDPRGKELTLRNIYEVDVAGRDTADRKKADIVLRSRSDNLPVSIKKVNADMWESADSLFGKRAREILDKLIDDEVITLKKVKMRGDTSVYALSKEVVMEPTEEEAMQAIFGSDINPKGGIVIQTFKPEHFVQDKNNITIECHAVIATREDLPESHIMVWLLRNDSDRNSKSIGIAGIRPLGVTLKRAFGAKGDKNVVVVDVDGNVIEGGYKEFMSKEPKVDLKKHSIDDEEFLDVAKSISSNRPRTKKDTKDAKKDSPTASGVGRAKRK